MCCDCCCNCGWILWAVLFCIFVVAAFTIAIVCIVGHYNCKVKKLESDRKDELTTITDALDKIDERYKEYFQVK